MTINDNVRLNFYKPRYFGSSSNHFSQPVETVKPRLSVPSTVSDAEKQFQDAYVNAGGDTEKYEFFSELARKESGYNPYIQNKLGAPAYGYFQFMQGGKGKRHWNNIEKFAGVDIETFRNNPEIQIKAAHKLADAFMDEFTEKDLKKARELGYSDSALIAGAWLGGVGGVRKFLHHGINVDDKSWSKNKRIGTDIRTRMNEFNGYFKDGGILRLKGGTSKERMKAMYTARKDQVDRNMSQYFIPNNVGVTLINEVIDKANIVSGDNVLPNTAVGGYNHRNNTVYVKDNISDIEREKTELHELGHAADIFGVFSNSIRKKQDSYGDQWKQENVDSDKYLDDAGEQYADTVELRQFLNKEYGIPFDHVFTKDEITKLREAFSGKKYLIHTQKNKNGDTRTVFAEFDENNKIKMTDPAEPGYITISSKVFTIPKDEFSFRSLDRLSDLAWLHLLNDVADNNANKSINYAQRGGILRGFKNVDKVYNHLINLGATPEEAAGWTGAFIQESGLDHSKTSYMGARGIAQLLGDELKQYTNYINSRKLPDTWQNQINYIWDQIYNNEHVWNKDYNRLIKLGAKRTPEQEKLFQHMDNSKWGDYSYEIYRETVPYDGSPGNIAETFTWTFERPGQNEAMIDKRRAYAEQVYKLMNKNEDIVR